jgi:hypothetical protein
MQALSSSTPTTEELLRWQRIQPIMEGPHRHTPALVHENVTKGKARLEFIPTGEMITDHYLKTGS